MSPPRSGGRARRGRGVRCSRAYDVCEKSGVRPTPPIMCVHVHVPDNWPVTPSFKTQPVTYQAVLKLLWGSFKNSRVNGSPLPYHTRTGGAPGPPSPPRVAACSRKLRENFQIIHPTTSLKCKCASITVCVLLPLSRSQCRETMRFCTKSVGPVVFRKYGVNTL